MCTIRSTDRRLIYTFGPGRCGANCRGYIDREHSLGRKEGTFRIVIIRDSVAQGWYFKNGVIPVDLLEAFEAYTPDDLRLERSGWYDPWHPNAFGHAVIAGFIQQTMTDRDLLGW